MTCIEAELQEVFKKKDTIRESITSSLKKLIPEEKNCNGKPPPNQKSFFIVLGPTIGLFNRNRLGWEINKNDI